MAAKFTTKLMKSMKGDIMWEDRLGCWLAGIGIDPYTFFTIVLLVCITALCVLAYSIGKDSVQKETPKSQPKPEPKVIVYPPDCFYDQEKDK